MLTTARPATRTATHCPYCALQCAMTLTPSDAGAVVQAGPGGLCRKGWTSAALLDSPRRLTTPLVRDGRHGRLREATWDEALDRAADAFAAAQDARGADAVGVFGGGGLTNEKAYLLGKFARVVLRTSQIDYNGRFCMSSAAAGAMRSFGLDRGRRSRSPTSPRPTAWSWSAATSPRRCRLWCSTSRASGPPVAAARSCSPLAARSSTPTAPTPQPADSGDGLEVLAFTDPVRHVYKKVVVRDGVVTGAVLLGDLSTAGTVTQAFDRATALPTDRMHLLFNSFGAPAAVDAADLEDDAIECTCNAVTAGETRGCAADGCVTVADVARATRANSGCGSCTSSVTRLVETTPERELVPVRRTA